MEQQDLQHLQDKVLIATPKLAEDPLFEHALIYIYEHNLEQGCSGVIINKPTNLMLADVVARLEMNCAEEVFSKLNDVPIIIGGPMARQNAFILQKEYGSKSNKKQSSGQFLSLLTESKLSEIVADKKPAMDFEIALGFTSWRCGLLEEEVVMGCWVVQDIDQKILFDFPHEDRYAQAVGNLGVDFSYFIDGDGHG